MKIMYLKNEVSSYMDISIDDLEQRRDIILSSLCRKKDDTKLYLLVDYYMVFKKFEIVEKLLLLCKDMWKKNGSFRYFYLDLLIYEYNKKNVGLLSVMNNDVLNISIFVFYYIKMYLFTDFFRNRITKNCLDKQTYMDMIENALLNKLDIISYMSTIKALKNDDADVLFNFFMGHCYTEINLDECLKYFSKIDFEKTYFMNNTYNEIILVEFIKKKQYDYVIKGLKCLTKSNKIFCCEYYCNLIIVHLYIVICHMMNVLFC